MWHSAYVYIFGIHMNVERFTVPFKNAHHTHMHVESDFAAHTFSLPKLSLFFHFFSDRKVNFHVPLAASSSSD